MIISLQWAAIGHSTVRQGDSQDMFSNVNLMKDERGYMSVTKNVDWSNKWESSHWCYWKCWMFQLISLQIHWMQKLDIKVSCWLQVLNELQSIIQLSGKVSAKICYQL